MLIGFALAETGRTRKLYGASTGAHQFQRSSVVERSAVNARQRYLICSHARSFPSYSGK